MKSAKRSSCGVAGLLDAGQVVDDRLRVNLLLDVDGHDGDGQVFPVLLVLALPDELRIERRVARIEHGLGGLLLLGHEVAQFLGGDVFALVLVADGLDGGGGILGSRFACHDVVPKQFNGRVNGC